MQKVMTKPMILVTGATGQQGGAVASALLETGTSFRAMSRSTHKLENFKSQGVETTQGTLTDQGSLKKALLGMKQAFLVTTPFEEGPEVEVQQGINFVNAAKEAGVEHLVFSSVGGADQRTGIPHFESKWKIEQHIKKTGVPATIFRPVFFMENFASPWFFPQIQKGKLALPVGKDVPMRMISLDVIGHFVAEAFKNPSKYLNQTIEIASDTLSFSEAIQKISTKSGKKISYVEIPEDQAEENFGHDFSRMFRWFNEVGYSTDLESVRKWGIPLTDFETYLSRAEWLKKV